MKHLSKKTRAAALITAAVLALVALFGMTGCPNNAGGSGSGSGNSGGGGGGNSGGGGGGTPTPVYTQVAYGTNGADLQAWLQNTASATDLNYIELTGVPNKVPGNGGTSGKAGPLGEIIKESGKRVALKLPANVTEVDIKAFLGCKRLESIDLSACTSLTAIKMAAFKDCEALKAVRLPQSLTVIDNFAFKDCTALKEVELP